MNPNKFSCDKCKDKFCSSKEALRKHNETYHPEIRDAKLAKNKFPCTHCKKRLSN
jgi:hypothetical protein